MEMNKPLERNNLKMNSSFKRYDEKTMGFKGSDCSLLRTIIPLPNPLFDFPLSGCFNHIFKTLPNQKDSF